MSSSGVGTCAPLCSGAGSHLFLEEELSDVTVEVTPWRFPAHRLVLCAQSEVFARMLATECAEKESGRILIRDIRPKAVQLLLGYMYRGRVELENWQDTLELLRAAHKYQVEPLVQHCARHLESALSLGNVCVLLDASALYGLPQLREKCASLGVDAGFAVLRSKGFESLRRECVEELLAHPELNVDNELAVYGALRRWARMQRCRAGLAPTEEGVMAEMAPFLAHICFDDMPDTEKSEVPAAVLQPGGHRRRNCVPPSLLQHARAFAFSVCASEGSPEGADGACAAARFSLDAPRFLVGVRFALLLPPGGEAPAALPLTLSREGGWPPLAAFCPLAAAEGPPQREGRRRLDASLLLRTPWRLERGAAYRLTLAGQSVLLPRTRLITSTLITHSGRVDLSLHSECTLGLTALLVI